MTSMRFLVIWSLVVCLTFIEGNYRVRSYSTTVTQQLPNPRRLDESNNSSTPSTTLPPFNTTFTAPVFDLNTEEDEFILGDDGLLMPWSDFHTLETIEGIGKEGSVLPSDEPPLSSYSPQFIYPFEDSQKNQQPFAPPPASVSSTPEKNLFSEFTFKGVALSMTKSIVDMKAFTVGMKVPITPNFPVYDRKIFLPKMSAFIGFQYPTSLRLALSMSIPIQVVTAVSSLALQQKSFEWPVMKATDSVKRVGWTFSYRIDPKNGGKTAMGPTFGYFPPARIVQYLIPFTLIPPAILLGMIQSIVEILLFTLKIARYLQRVVAPPVHAMEHSKQKEGNSSSRLLANAELLPTAASFFNGVGDLFGFHNSYENIKEWMKKKNPIMSNAMSYTKCGKKFSFNSNLEFDIQPFYPFKDFFQRLTSKQRKSKTEKPKRKVFNPSRA